MYSQQNQLLKHTVIEMGSMYFTGHQFIFYKKHLVVLYCLLPSTIRFIGLTYINISKVTNHM